MMNNDIIINLKKFISNFIENRQFAKITTGTILSISPLRVQLSNNLILDSSMISITWTDEQLEPHFVGKTIFLIRQDGGGYYYALYKEVKK